MIKHVTFCLLALVICGFLIGLIGDSLESARIQKVKDDTVYGIYLAGACHMVPEQNRTAFYRTLGCRERDKETRKIEALENIACALNQQETANVVGGVVSIAAAILTAFEDDYPARPRPNDPRENNAVEYLCLNPPAYDE